MCEAKSRPVIIQKFGGKLLETPEKIKQAAAYIISKKESGVDPVVVVSAPGKTTDQFMEMITQITDHPTERETDMLLSVGERMTMALLAMAINSASSHQAVSYTGSQVGIITDNRHTRARILEVKGYRLKEALAVGQIPIIAGFQGVSLNREITTLGRGGSDLTAMALAVALRAEYCELVKECAGIFTADPEIVPEAIRRDGIDYITLSELTSAGAKIIQQEAAAIAEDHKVAITIGDITGNPGTMVSETNLSGGLVAGLVLEEGLQVIRSAEFPRDLQTLSGVKYASTNGKECLTVAQNCGDEASQVALLNVIGWGGFLDPVVINTCLQYFMSSGIVYLGAIMLHGKLSILVNAADGREILQKIHSLFQENGYFD